MYLVGVALQSGNRIVPVDYTRRLERFWVGYLKVSGAPSVHFSKAANDRDNPLGDACRRDAVRVAEFGGPSAAGRVLRESGAGMKLVEFGLLEQDS